MTRLRAGAATDVGLARANNQDQLLVATPIFAVADGMGGHAAGEVASQTAVDALQGAFEAAVASPESVVEAARAANRAVWNRAQAHAELRGMGTTLTAIALVPHEGVEVMAVVNVGDSRTYRLRDGTLQQVTVDHSYVAELVAGGQIDEAEAEVHPQRHVLTRALGVSPDVDVDLIVLSPLVGDRYLLCSDGLSREVADSQVASILRRLGAPDEAARELVTEAKLHGGNDNITVVVVDVIDVDVVDSAGLDGDGLDADAAGLDDDAPTAALPIGPATRTQHAETPHAETPRAQTPRARLLTGRVVGFVLLLVAIVFVAAAGTEYYARSTYYVGLEARQLTIFKGRPGGVLWWKPTIAQRTGVTTGEVDAYHLASLRAGVQENSVSDAHTYVTRLRAEKAAVAVQPLDPSPPAAQTKRAGAVGLVPAAVPA